MPHKFAELAFTKTVRQIQVEMGSRDNYKSMDGGPDFNCLISQMEAAFIASRDSFYMATVGDTGWPYVQHRGGPAGFVKVIDEKTIGFSDYAGNRQYVSTGNLRSDDRVSLFFMDYPNRRRLKLLGRVSEVRSDDLETLAALEDDHYRAPIERAFIIKVEGFDWNCPKYITPRYTESDVKAVIDPLQEELAILRAGAKADVTEQRKIVPTVLGDGPLTLQVTAIRQEAEAIRSYELRHPEGQPLPPIEAGGHMQVPMLAENGEIIWRFYSLCSDPDQQDFYQIAVLKHEEGLGGSLAVHDQYQVGQTLSCYQPGNYFSLQHEAHIAGAKAVLIAGGIGITPIRSMLMTAQKNAYDFEIHYAARSKSSGAFIDDVQSHNKEANIYLSAENQRLDLNALFSRAEESTIHYLCGPEAMLTAARQAAKECGMPANNLVFETFED